MARETMIAKTVSLNANNAVSNTLRFRKVGNTLYGDKATANTIGKESVSYDSFNFGLSQRWVKNGYKIAITGDV